MSQLCLAIASLTLATGAAAQGDPTGNSYIGLNAGRTDFKIGNDTSIYANESSNTSLQINMGSYFKGSNLGAELGYIDFGNIDRAGGRTSAHGINLSLIGRIPLGTSFNLLGKAGGIYSRTSVSAAPASGVPTGNESDLGWTYGVGLEYAFARQWSGVVQYDDYNLKFAGGERDRISNLSLGVRYLY
jgi:opacity protein-like surface antigen